MDYICFFFKKGPTSILIINIYTISTETEGAIIWTHSVNMYMSTLNIIVKYALYTASNSFWMCVNLHTHIALSEQPA